ncbi:DUF3993 domain-containing protein [Bacillus canaveralius]|uniref:DUF3993 domain-containing protein n=1 Tax=Bacillus canaveralius TaxID=1403243 RepID=UPI000F767F42|nr:DUF3993 domain-containing protein [Bacillus canaveralius]RSK53062.1 DUF3993 domain-containing protein [Bacillus canaveralius]
MSRHLLKFLPAIMILLLITPLSAQAVNDLTSREDVFRFLEESLQAQVSLTEKTRTMEEIDEILDRYFTSEYKSVFLKENIVKEGGKYVTYGSDSAPYYIPFFDFSEVTEVEFFEDEIFVYEYFPEKHEGPVGYESHYEGLLLEKENNNWKVSEYLFSVDPAEMIGAARKKVQTDSEAHDNFVFKEPFFANLEPASYSFYLSIASFSAFLQNVAAMSNHHQEEPSQTFLTSGERQ